MTTRHRQRIRINNLDGHQGAAPAVGLGRTIANQVIQMYVAIALKLLSLTLSLASLKPSKFSLSLSPTWTLTLPGLITTFE